MSRSSGVHAISPHFQQYPVTGVEYKMLDLVCQPEHVPGCHCLGVESTEIAAQRAFCGPKALRRFAALRGRARQQTHCAVTASLLRASRHTAKPHGNVKAADLHLSDSVLLLHRFLQTYGHKAVPVRQCALQQMLAPPRCCCLSLACFPSQLNGHLPSYTKSCCNEQQ